MSNKWQATSERLKVWGRAFDDWLDTKPGEWTKESIEESLTNRSDLLFGAKLCSLMASAPDAEMLEAWAHLIDEAAGGSLEQTHGLPAWLRSVAALLREEEE